LLTIDRCSSPPCCPRIRVDVNDIILKSRQRRLGKKDGYRWMEDTGK
jgi:hypothetical protein